MFATIKLSSIKEYWAALAEQCSFIFTNGCFDILTPAHVATIRWAVEAYKEGNPKRKLIIGLNSDESVKRLKGPSRPFHTLEQRAAVLLAIKGVDIVMPFDEDNPIELIKFIKPDIMFKGGDYEGQKIVGAPTVAAYGGITVCAPFIPGVSTTRTLAGLEGKLDLLRELADLLLPVHGQDVDACSECGVTDKQVDFIDLSEAILKERANMAPLTESGHKALSRKYSRDHRVWNYFDKEMLSGED